MRKLIIVMLAAGLLVGCQSSTPVGPGKVVVTETTTIVPVPPTTTIPVDTKALFQFSPQTPEVLQTVFFNASTSVPGSDRTITNYSWDFGDGVSKSGLTTQHDFFPSGVYLVTLTVTDSLGKKTMFSQPVTVRPVVPVPGT